MAKKKGILGDLLDALGDSGGEIISDLMEELTGASISASQGDHLLEGLMEGGSNLMEGLGDVVSDLTGAGAVNTEASAVAQLDGKVKSSAARKKTIKSSAAKKTTTARKNTAAASAKTGAKAVAAKSSTAKKVKKTTTAKKTTAARKTTSADTKVKSSATKKKTI